MEGVGGNGHRENRVLVTLQHALDVSGGRIPELHRPVLGTGDDPLAIGREGHREDKVLVTGADLPARRALVLAPDFPQPDGLVQ